MRIVSSFKDYYDSAQRYGVDLTLVYRRETEHVLGPNVRHAVEFPHHHWDPFRATVQFVHFCGRVHPLIAVRGAEGEVWFHYEADRHHAWCEEHLGSRERYLYDEGDRDWHWYYIHGRRDDASPWSRRGVDRLFTEPPACLCTFESPIVLEPSHGPGAHVSNPRLEPLEFFRVYDTYSAFQELATWLPTQARPEPDVPVPDDTTMRDIKGFDDSSFKRSSPGKKERRRRRARERREGGDT